MTSTHTCFLGAAWNPPAQPVAADAASAAAASATDVAGGAAAGDALEKVRRLHDTRFRAMSCLGNMVGAHADPREDIRA